MKLVPLTQNCLSGRLYASEQGQIKVGKKHVDFGWKKSHVWMTEVPPKSVLHNQPQEAFPHAVDDPWILFYPDPLQHYPCESTFLV